VTFATSAKLLRSKLRCTAGRNRTPPELLRRSSTTPRNPLRGPSGVRFLPAVANVVSHRRQHRVYRVVRSAKTRHPREGLAALFGTYLDRTRSTRPEARRSLKALAPGRPSPAAGSFTASKTARLNPLPDTRNQLTAQRTDRTNRSGAEPCGRNPVARRADFRRIRSGPDANTEQKERTDVSHYPEYARNLVEIRPFQTGPRGAVHHIVMIDGKPNPLPLDSLAEACEQAIKASYGHLYVRMSTVEEVHYAKDAPISEVAALLAERIGNGIVRPTEALPKAKNTPHGIAIRAALGLD